MSQRLRSARTLTLLLIFTLFLSFFGPFAEARAMDGKEMEAFWDEAMAAQMAEHQLANAAVSVVADGKVLLSKGYGHAELKEQLPVDGERTLFRIGSTSKVFTWTAVMQLAEQGKLDLNADVNTYLDFAIPPYTGKTSGDATEPRPITMMHLLTHTPGFEDYSETIFRISPAKMPPLSEYVRTYMPTRIYPAGEVAAYSNYGTALAGYIVERISGLPFSQYIERHILAPLQMNNSTFRQPLPDDLAANRARPYRYVDGQFVEGAFEYVPEAAGAMSASAADMAKFMLAYLQGGSGPQGSFLRPETVKKMSTQLFTHHPALNGMAYGLIEGAVNGERTLFHSGSTMLFDSGFYMLPERQTGVFIVYSGGNYQVHTELFQQFMDRWYANAQTPPVLAAPSEGAAERARAYVGEYQQNRRSVTTSESFMSLMMGVVQIDVDAQGYLLATFAGETSRFAETEPGVYRSDRQGRSPDYFGDFRTLVFQTDPFGRTMLAAGGPMTYTQAPWYATSASTFGMLALVLLVIVISLIGWGAAGVLRLARLRSRKSGEQADRTYSGNGPRTRSRLRLRTAAAATWTAAAFGLLTLGCLVGVAATGAVDPVYGLPKVAFGEAAGIGSLLDWLSRALLPLGAALVALAVIVWVKRCWGWLRRIHYTLYTLAAVLLLAIFFYWHLI